MNSTDTQPLEDRSVATSKLSAIDLAGIAGLGAVIAIWSLVAEGLVVALAMTTLARRSTRA
jgi:hypothetical protein